ncbi:MAG: glutaredoxin family protein [Acidobacteria bacterium]|nr:MAG: glutaredoxin family protein [Acidobacteriota bacterium]
MRLTLYSKPGCHLCDEMKIVVRAVIADRPDISLDEIDISAMPDLLDRYGLEIPVLMIDGRRAAKYRISALELERIIEGRA